MALQVLIKPVSSSCNMDCEYCFYKDEARERKTENYGKMSFSTLKAIIEKALAADGNSIIFNFQGGEPTLIGMDFYIAAVECAQKLNLNNKEINWGIQTNGYTLNDEWADFFAKNRFLVGLSLDGTKDIHNYFRKDNYGKNTFTSVLRTVNLFNKHNVEYNIVTVISSANVKKAETIYNFIKKNNFKYIQFIPCLDRLSGEKSAFSLSGDIYGDFLNDIFDAWYEDWLKGNYISISIIDGFIHRIMGKSPTICGLDGRCNCQFLIEADGGVYPCDFYVLDDFKIGNINENSLDEIFNRYKNTACFNNDQKPEKCKVCKWEKLCNNGCKRYRDKNNLNILCGSYAKFFENSYSRMLNIAENLKRYF